MDEKALISFFTRQKKYEISDSSILIPVNLKRRGLSEIINQLLNLNPKIEFDFILDGKFLKNTIKHYLDDNSLSTENVTRIEVVEATLPPVENSSMVHDDWISSIKMNDSNQILTGSYDCNVRIWDNSGKISHSFTMGMNPVKSVAWIDGETFVAGDSKDQIIGFKVSKNLVEYFRCRGHENGIESLAVCPQGGVFASASWDKTIRVWSSENKTSEFMSKGRGKRQKVDEIIFKGCDGAVSCIKFDNSNPNLLYSTSWDHSIRIWDMEEKIDVQRMSCEKIGISLEHLHDSKLIATGHVDGIIRLWDPRSKDGLAIKLKLGSHKNWVSSVAKSPESEYGLVSGSYDGAIKLWDMRSKIPLHTMLTESKVFSIDWKNTTIAAAGDDSKIHVFSTIQ